MTEDEKLGQNPDIIEITSGEDLAKVEGILMLKYVHLKRGNEDFVYVGDEEKVDHWQLTGLAKAEAEKTPVYNAGLIYQSGNRRVLLGFSGGLSNETDELVKLARLNKSKKIQLDEETVRVLNEKTGGENFEAKSNLSE